MSSKIYLFKLTSNTVKPVYNDHPRDLEKVVVVQRWSLFRGSNTQEFIFFNLKKSNIKKMGGAEKMPNCNSPLGCRPLS